MIDNMDIDNMDINQLEKEIIKRQEEIFALKQKRKSIKNNTLDKNNTLNSIAEKIATKIVEDKLYQNEDLDYNHVRINSQPHKFSEGVSIQNYREIDGYLEETEISDNLFSDVLSITFNIRYDDELRKIMKQNWKLLDNQKTII